MKAVILFFIFIIISILPNSTYFGRVEKKINYIITLLEAKR